MQVIAGIYEKDLIKRLIYGDPHAFEVLFNFYYPGLVIFVSQIVQDHFEAEEIVQDFFVNLWIKRKNIILTDSLKHYFFTSVKNSSFNYLKKAKINERTINNLKKIIENETTYNIDVFVESEIQNKLKNALKQLPPRTLEIITLSRFNGLKNDEIANKLNLSKRTVETQISNALRILRNKLGN